MDCGKDSYSKAGAHSVRDTIYHKRKKKLRCYECHVCHHWHLTSSVKGSEYDTRFKGKK